MKAHVCSLQAPQARLTLPEVPQARKPSSTPPVPQVIQAEVVILNFAYSIRDGAGVLLMKRGTNQAVSSYPWR